MPIRALINAGAIALLTAGLATVQAAEEPKTPLQLAIGKYGTAVDGLSAEMDKEYSATELRREILSKRLGLYQFTIANFQPIEQIPDPAITGFRMNVMFGLREDSVPGKPEPHPLGDDWYDHWEDHFLCDPLAQVAQKKASLVPIQSVQNRLAAGSTRSSKSGLALLAEALGGDYSISTSDLQNGEDLEQTAYRAVYDRCTADMRSARSAYNIDLMAEAGIERVGGVTPLLESLSATRTLLTALGNAVNGIARMIANRRQDAAIREFIMELEPYPAGDSRAARRMREATDKANAEIRAQNAEVQNGSRDGEIQPLRTNFVRDAIAVSKADLAALTEQKRQRAARAYYQRFQLFQSEYNTLMPPDPNRSDAALAKVQVTDEDGVRTVTLNEDQVLTRAGMTSSERYEAVGNMIGESGYVTLRDELLAAAEAYDLAYASGGASSLFSALDTAWSALVRDAYDPDPMDLGTAIALLTEVEGAIEGVGLAFDVYRVRMNEIEWNPKKDEDSAAEAKTEASD